MQIFLALLIFIILIVIVIRFNKIQLAWVKHSKSEYSPEYFELYYSIYQSSPHSNPIWNSLRERLNTIFEPQLKTPYATNIRVSIVDIDSRIKTKSDFLLMHGTPNNYHAYKSKEGKYLEVADYYLKTAGYREHLLVYFYDEIWFLSEIEQAGSEQGQAFNESVVTAFLLKHHDKLTINDINYKSNIHAIIDSDNNMAVLTKHPFYYSVFYFNDLELTQLIIDEALK